ncbi:protein-disulfide reductase DsbD domain-containing protein [Pseudoalteromonas sp. MelDa3]|uniref:protein-disulfide reductase DsbD domain-containing protein n=1 Tax=Pseudoalteromonas sp. MelDa3 TaxID=888435 RepID=UPI0015E14FC0|nr:protein-disulfide reductase DsbD domain-containing protein [Pseudoalteromonas sp. MelDa3]
MLTSILSASLIMVATSVNLNIDSALPTDKPTFLHHEQAFILSYELTDTDVELTWDVAPGYYLYQNTMKVNEITKDALQFTSTPVSAHDEYFGTTMIVKTHAAAHFAKSALNQSTFTVSYRGCAEAGLCYPPVTVEINL